MDMEHWWNESDRETSTNFRDDLPGAFRPPQTAHALVCDRNRTSAMRLEANAWPPVQWPGSLMYGRIAKWLWVMTECNTKQKSFFLYLNIFFLIFLASGKSQLTIHHRQRSKCQLGKSSYRFPITFFSRSKNVKSEIKTQVTNTHWRTQCEFFYLPD